MGFFGKWAIGTGFRTFKLSESLRNRFKTILLDQEMDLKKIPSKNIFSSWRKMSLKKKPQKKSRNFWFFQLENWFFKLIFYLKKSIFQLKKSKCIDFFASFFKIIFLHDEKIFFDGIFLKSYLLIEENRLEAIPEWFRQFKAEKRI